MVLKQKKALANRKKRKSSHLIPRTKLSNFLICLCDVSPMPFCTTFQFYLPLFISNEGYWDVRRSI